MKPLNSDVYFYAFFHNRTTPNTGTPITINVQNTQYVEKIIMLLSLAVIFFIKRSIGAKNVYRILNKRPTNI